MTDETIVQPDEGSESLPVATVPKSDAEAAVLEAAATPEVQESEKPKPDPVAQDKEERQRNRTTQYIERLKAEVAALRAATPQPVQQAAKAPEGEPTLDKYDYDIAAFTRAHADWAVKEALSARDQEQQTRAKETERQESLHRYEEQIQAALDDYPDFYEVVGSIDPQFISPELEAAIVKHPQGARIAYHIGTNDDDAFLLASTRPEMVGAAVERLAKRLNAPAPAAIPAAPKPITKAPAPPPSLAGKSSVTVPPEKLTDDEWFARERERARKR